jgi:hypothetical protein
MSQTVLLAKEIPGGVAGLEWTVGGEDGAIEVNAAYAEHLMLIPESDFFIVARGDESEKPAEKVTKKAVEKKAKATESAPLTDTEDDLTAALKVASSTSVTAKE